MEEPEHPPSPYQPARSARTEVRSRFGLSPVWVAIGSIGIVLLLVYGANKLFEATVPAPAPAAEVPRDESPGLDGIIAAGAPASQFQVGDCLNDFQGPLEPATIVTCRTPHSAQLIGLATLPETPYPGDARTTAKAEEACKSIQLDPAALGSVRWNYEFSRPSQGTWAEGDRAVACFLVALEGTAQRSVLPADATP